VGTVVQVRDVMTGTVIREMTVVVMVETETAVTVVTQDQVAGTVAVTVIQIETEDEMTGRVLDGTAATLVGDETVEMTAFPSKFWN